MNTDEKNRYISEQMGWYVHTVGKNSKPVVTCEGPDINPGESYYYKDRDSITCYKLFDHLSNAFAYVVPWLRENGISIFMLNVDTIANHYWQVDMSAKRKGVVSHGRDNDIHQAICEAFIEYCRGKDDT